MAIVSEHAVYKLYIYSLVNLKDKGGCGYCFRTVYKLYIHSLVNSKDKGGCGYCFSTMNAHSTH